jgi:epoxyqueuosine reductase QueG
MISPQTIKELATQLGADLCGIAPVDRFDSAPKGFHPKDLFPQAKSVVAIARRFPEGPFHALSPIPYTVTSDVLLAEVTRLTCQLCDQLERHDHLRAVPVPSEPYEYWDAMNHQGLGPLSLKHAAALAGLGVMGKNTLLTNRQFGNRLCLGAALLDVELPGDPLADDQLCADDCSRCIDACPARAIDASTVNQKRCRDNSESHTPKGDHLYVCNKCRTVCPNATGTQTFASA